MRERCFRTNPKRMATDMAIANRTRTATIVHDYSYTCRWDWFLNPKPTVGEFFRISSTRFRTSKTNILYTVSARLILRTVKTRRTETTATFVRTFLKLLSKSLVFRLHLKVRSTPYKPCEIRMSLDNKYSINIKPYKEEKGRLKRRNRKHDFFPS